MLSFKLLTNYAKKVGFTKYSKNFFSAGSNNGTSNDEIHIRSRTVEHFFPIRGIPEFTNGVYTVFENKQLDTKVPYQIKEYSMKGFLYTLFLSWVGRYIGAYTNAKWASTSMLYSYIPASVFAFFYGKVVWTMVNAVTAIRLKDNGTHVVFDFKLLQPSLQVEISRIKKVEPETVFNECYFEPTLYPLEIDYEDVYSKFSFLSKRRVYVYMDSHESIKNGEIFRAILNGQNVKVK